MKKLIVVCLFVGIMIAPAGADFSLTEGFDTGLNGWTDQSGVMTASTDVGWGGVAQLTSATAYQHTRIYLPDTYDGDWGDFGTGDQTIQFYAKNADGYGMYDQVMYFISSSAGSSTYSQWHRSFGANFMSTTWSGRYAPFNADWTDAQANANGWTGYALGAGWADTVANVDDAHIVTYGHAAGLDAMIDAFTPGMVPEPATMVLIGLGGLFLRKRRK